MLLRCYFAGDGFFAAGDADGLAAGDDAGFTVAAADADGVAAGVVAGVAAGVAVADGEGDGDATGTVADCNTEFEPVSPGSANNNASSMNEIAAPIVILAKIFCVPRGPNAVLETLLVNKAPASALPGCNRTTTTSTRQDRMKRVYRV